MFTHYDLRTYKGDEKNVEIRVVCGVRSLKVISNITFRCSVYDFLYRNYVSILYRFRVIVNYSSKVADFNVPHLHLVPR